MKVLGIFPDLHDTNPGGIQVSGEIAWQMLQRQTTAEALFVSGRIDAALAARRLDFQPDLILIWHLDFLRLAPVFKKQAPRVVFLHGIEAWRKQSWINRKLLANTSVIANSSYTIARAKPFLPALERMAPQIVPLGWGLPTSVTAPLPHPPAAVMIGRLDAGERYKGHHEVMAAWPAVRRIHADAQLWIIGDGDLRTELEQHATALELSDAIRFFGRISESEKERLLCAARCLVLPSRAEGFGLVYVEAMRAGRPCIVGNDAGVEVIDPPQAGLSVDPADTKALGDALTQLLTLDSEWERKCEAARKRYVDHFTAVHFQNRLWNALQRVH